MRSLNVARHRRGPCWPVPSAETFRAPGATIADKAAVGLLPAALSPRWLFEREYSLDETGLRTEITTQSLALAANLVPEPRFLMFLRQTGETPEARLRAVQSFPARHLSSAQGRPAAFRPPSGGADPGRPDRVFAGAAGPPTSRCAGADTAPGWHCRRRCWPSPRSTVHYADMISTEIAGLFGIWLTAYGLVRFAHDGRLRPLLAKAGARCCSVGTSWACCCLSWSSA